jgi:predicted flap endonuclease-1-like 5' DNA nuclease
MRGRRRRCRVILDRRLSLNGLTFVALIALAVGIGVAYRAGALRARRDTARHPAQSTNPIAVPSAQPKPPDIVRATRPDARAERAQLSTLADDRAALFRALAEAKTETARYRQIVVDIERNAPPPLLDAPGTPDDLKLIVGVGPVIERILYQLGIGTYRQIAKLSDREIDDIEARLAEFPGRIRRDGWVTQARTLHVAKYGTNP